MPILKELDSRFRGNDNPVIKPFDYAQARNDGAKRDRIPPSQATGLNKRFDFSLFHLDINFVHHSWECDALTDVLFSGQRGDGSFYAEPEYAES